MSLETTSMSENNLSNRSSTELPLGDGHKLTIMRVIENSQMFQLPNKPELTNERLRLTAKVLAKQYTVALQHDKRRTETLSEISDLLQADKDDDWIRNVKGIFEKAPQEAAPELMGNLEYLPEGIREEVARLALEKAPQEVARGLMWNLRYLPEGIREEVARLALEKAPQEVAPELMGNLEYLPEGVREEIESQLVEILRKTERDKITESENINPTLYKEIEGLEEQFSRKEFPKTGTRTVLLGGTLKNNAILRIIPNHAFISWVNAYSAVEDWKEAGFDYVPIEPILKASLCKDDKDVRVYAGVLGVSVAKYLEMHSNREHHQDVNQQVRAIIKTLAKMGIRHGHMHDDNFCVLHNRTPKGEIDWSKPPRVYCIDFDQSISS